MFIHMMEKTSRITNFIKTPDYDYLIKLLALGKWNFYYVGYVRQSSDLNRLLSFYCIFSSTVQDFGLGSGLAEVWPFSQIQLKSGSAALAKIFAGFLDLARFQILLFTFCNFM